MLLGRRFWASRPHSRTMVRPVRPSGYSRFQYFASLVPSALSCSAACSPSGFGQRCTAFGLRRYYPSRAVARPSVARPLVAQNKNKNGYKNCSRYVLVINYLRAQSGGLPPRESDGSGRAEATAGRTIVRLREQGAGADSATARNAEGERGGSPKSRLSIKNIDYH